MKKLTLIQIISVSMMLFAIFFGAGNMIFPPAMGQLAGTSYISALAGFILTDAGIAILGVTAVVLAGTSMSDLGNLVSRRFALVLSVGVYLLIGPLFALPRTGSVSFEIALLPYIGENNAILWSLLFTTAFFGLTYYLSSNPSRIVDVVGKYLTPVLLISILAIFIASLLQDTSNGAFSFGTMMEPSPAYADIPFFKGMIEGYNALDGPAGLAFAILVITAIRSYGVTDKKYIARYTILCGLGAAGFLAGVYFMLTYVGAITNTPFTNGGALLHAVTNHLFGGIGGIILGIAVLFACLTTSIVIMIYPLTVVLMLLSFLKQRIGSRRMVYIMAMLFTFAVSFVNGMESAGVSLGIISDWFAELPFYELSIGWILPAVAGALIGLLPFWPMNNEGSGLTETRE